MVMIPQINDTVMPEGHVEIMRRAQAKAEDFGGQVAQAQAGLGRDIGEAATAFQDHLDTQDVTNVYTKMAQARADWTQNLKDRVNATTPGDQSLVPGMVQAMGQYFNDGSQGAQGPQTQKGQKLWATMSAGLQSEMTEKAIGQQSMLDGQAAANDHEKTQANLGAAVYADEKQLPGALATANAAIDDPNGMYSRVPQTVRDKFKQDTLQRLSFAASSGFNERNPATTIQALGPNIEAFKPGEALVQATAAPGATVNLSPETLAKAPQVIPAAAQTGVIPNVLLGQIEVGGTEPQKVNDQAVSMAALLKTYGGDYHAALGAYHIGTNAVDAAMQQFGMDWESHIPSEAQTYIDSVMKKGGMVPGAPAVPGTEGASQPAPATPSTPGTPTQSAIPGWNNLSWEQQSHLAQRAVELQNQQLAEGRRQREEAKIAQAEARDSIMTQALRQLDDPKTNGKFDLRSYQNNPTLDWRDIHALDDISNQHRRELMSDENRANPFAFHQLMVQIHAADTDPTKTYSDENAFAAYRNGQISWGQFATLRNEVTQMKDGGTSPFQKQLWQVKEVGTKAFTQDPLAIGPGMAAAQEAGYRFTTDLDAKVDQYRKANKDPRALLTPGSPDYVFKDPNWAAHFKPDYTAEIAKQAAANDPFKVGETYTDPKTNIARPYLGGGKFGPPQGQAPAASAPGLGTRIVNYLNRPIPPPTPPPEVKPQFDGSSIRAVSHGVHAFGQWLMTPQHGQEPAQPYTGPKVSQEDVAKLLADFHSGKPSPLAAPDQSNPFSLGGK